MSRTDPIAPRRPGEQAPLATIAGRGNQLPHRVRQLLEGMLALTGGVLERPLSQTLTEFEQQLFKAAEKARTSSDQHEVFEALREIKRGRADIAPRFMMFLESALATLDTAATPAATPAASSLPRELSLVADKVIEENITLQEIATKAEIRHSQALYALGHRFGVLACAPLFDAEHVPLGPHCLGEAIRYASSCIDIKIEFRQLLYRQFDRSLMAELGMLYTALNDYLIDKRILRCLTVIQHKLRPNPAAAGAAAGAPRGTEAAAPPPPEAAAPGIGNGLPGYASGPPTPMPPLAARGRPAADAPAPVQDVRDSELFTTLRELLAGRRMATGAADAAAPGRSSDYTASTEDLQSVLGSLQGKPIAPMVLGGRVVQRNMAHVKQDMLAQLRQFTPDGKPPRLAEEDSDTLDLVGMLFDYVLKDARPSGATQSLLTKLQVPVLRVALRDKTFFSRRSHPARQLLNAIAETGQYWVDEGDGDADRTLVEKMQLVVDRVTSEYDGRPELFEELLSDLSRHMNTLARKAEVAERRHVDAARGRERLDVAREHAAAAIAQRLAKAKPTRLVRTLLEQAWTDVLALTLLRQGDDSEQYQRRLNVADQLIAGTEPTPAVRQELEQGLSQVGFVGDEIQTMVRQLVAPQEHAEETNPASRTELAMKLKSKARLGDDAGGTAGTAPRAPLAAVASTLGAEERQTLERLKTLPFGTWFEFVTNQQGAVVRRKLSWFSTLTGRCLFVNQRGARADERTLEQLARDLVRGQVRIAPVERESLIDRAWNALVGALRQFAGQPTPAATPAAG